MTAAVPAAEGMRRDGVGTGDCEWLLQLGAEAACILLPKKRGWTVGGGGGICRAATRLPRDPIKGSFLEPDGCFVSVRMCFRGPLIYVWWHHLAPPLC